LLSILTPSADEIIGDHDFEATGELLIIYSAFAKHLRKKETAIKQCINY
jgi:hypothetical protein